MTGLSEMLETPEEEAQAVCIVLRRVQSSLFAACNSPFQAAKGAHRIARVFRGRDRRPALLYSSATGQFVHA